MKQRVRGTLRDQFKIDHYIGGEDESVGFRDSNKREIT
jgi:hypothetical protein